MLVINIAGILLIGLIIWWFWLYQPKERHLDDGDLIITVDNGVYQPARLKVQARQPIELKFMRKDASPCAETLLIPELDISETLPLGQIKSIKLPPLNPGKYAFHCQMQMYRGEIEAQ